MKFSEEDIKKLEQLSKLQLSKEERVARLKDLESILDYAKELEELDTSKVLPTSQVTGLINRVREDDAKKQDLPVGESLLEHSKQDVEMKQLKVPNVL